MKKIFSKVLKSGVVFFSRICVSISADFSTGATFQVVMLGVKTHNSLRLKNDNPWKTHNPLRLENDNPWKTHNPLRLENDNPLFFMIA